MSYRQNTKHSSATYGVQPRSSKGSNPSSQREIVNKKIKLENMRKISTHSDFRNEKTNLCFFLTAMGVFV